MTALHYAANAGHLGVVETLLVAKADVHAIDEVRKAVVCCEMCCDILWDILLLFLHTTQTTFPMVCTQVHFLANCSSHFVLFCSTARLLSIGQPQTVIWR